MVGKPACSVGFSGLALQNSGFGLQSPYFAQTLSFAGGSEGLGWEGGGGRTALFKKGISLNKAEESPKLFFEMRTDFLVWLRLQSLAAKKHLVAR